LRAGAIQEQLVRARWPVLWLAAIAFLGAAICLANYWGPVGAAAAETAAIAVAAGASALWLVRSPLLTLLAALTPLLTGVIALGVLTSIAIGMPALCAVLIPHAIATILLPTAGAALVTIYLFDLQAGAGEDPDAAAWNATQSIRLPGLTSLAMATVWRVFFLLPDDLMQLQPPAVRSTDVSLIATSIASMAAAATCLILLPLALGAIRLSEDHISNANRRREKRERVLAFLEPIAVPRWALSLTGIAGVFTVLAILGDQSGTSPILAAVRAQGVMFPATVMLAGAAGTFVTRDWRGFFTCSVPSGLAAIWSVPAVLGPTIALSVPGDGPLLEASVRDLPCVTASLAAGVCCLVASRLAAHRRLNDLPIVAFAHSAREVAIPILAIASVMALILFPLGLELLPLVGAAAALMLTPALTILIALTFPRLKSVEELYARKRVEPS
jgi:hypothetical protein